MKLRSLALLCLVSSLAACIGPGIGERGPRYRSAPLPEEAPAAGRAIVVCGEQHDIGAPVVLWTDPGGYDATSTQLHFGPPPAGVESPEPGTLRYDPGRVDRGSGARLVAPNAPLSALREQVDQFVLHYDVCGTSRTCFKVLQDRRGLSVHFMLDLDGTLYQTMDLVHQAWHASQANPRSIGIEIANMGAYPVGSPSPLDQWYEVRDGVTRLRIPAAQGDGGLRNPGASLRPRRPERIRGPIQGQQLEMYDLTPEQYATLTRLAATLCELFPRIEPEAPRGPDGRVATRALSDAQWQAFHGILGHDHVTERKADPGPAFDWEWFLQGVRRELGARP